MSPTSVGRAFGNEDQIAFAELSGDRNPMHMDPGAARRTPAGAPVVHGVQAMLWAMETLARTIPLGGLGTLDADFARFLYVGETATLIPVRHTDAECVAELRSGSGRVAQYVLRFGPRKPAPGPVAAGAICVGADAAEPLPLTWEDVAVASGRVAFRQSPARAARAYPALSDAIGAGRVSAILAATRLVGMVSPGLHSTFHRMSLSLHDDPPGADDAGWLNFATTKADPRYAVATIAVSAPGVSGTVKASRRTPPVAQPDSASLRPLIAAGCFAGNVAMVVGGSRGIGEVTAKLLGLAGVETIVTYAAGAADADVVVADIRACGGRAVAWPLDVRQPVTPQLAGMPAVPGSVYYFATPRIGLRAGAAFDAVLFANFTTFYLDAFQDLCAALAGAPLQVFYPSTVYVGDAPRGLAEYAMAKAAGEVLAADMTRFAPNVSVECVRLPRLPTDQTAGMIEHETGSAAGCMAPVIERMERRAMAAKRLAA